MTATTTKPALICLGHTSIVVRQAEPLTLGAARALVGRRVNMPTLQANEFASYAIDSVSQNRETGDLVAWMVRPGKLGGHHATLVTPR